MSATLDRRNYPLLLTGQFLGAFGDNFLLAAILSPLTFAMKSGEIGADYVSRQNTLFSAAFFVPFLLLAPLAGYLNDRMPKTTWLAGGNAIKMLGTLLGMAGIWGTLDHVHGAQLWQLTGYFLVGVGACVYSPAKYGILPEVVRSERLVKANGTVEMLTLVAILGGLAGGAYMYDHTRSLMPCYVASASFYGLAFVCTLFMTRTPFNPSCTLGQSVSAFGTSLRTLASHPRLGRILLGCMLFWFAGAALRNNLQGWGLQLFSELGITEVSNEKLAALKAVLVVGIVSGSLLAGQLHKLGDLSWARRYGALMALCIGAMGLVVGGFGLWGAIAMLALTGLFSGLLLVPLNAALQAESDQATLGKTVAVQNFCDYLGMLAGAALLWVFTLFHLSPAAMCTGLALSMGVVSLALRVPGLIRR